MRWNWELPDWPKFHYDPNKIAPMERQFLLGIGSAIAYLKTIDASDYKRFVVEILSWEGAESSKIEGEILDRESLQSSIKRHFGIIPGVIEKSGIGQGGSADFLAGARGRVQEHDPKRGRKICGKADAGQNRFFSHERYNQDRKKESEKEASMAQLLCSVYESFDKPLTHEMLWEWHSMLFKDSSKIEDLGKYRTHPEPMQIVSNRYDSPKVFFEAPPSARVFDEMSAFIGWFNSKSDSILGKAAIAHVYFESIHPFEDGNGRIGRVLSEKILSQGVGRPVLIAISKLLEKRKKEYYSALEKCNRTLEAEQWVEFFGSIIMQAHEESMRSLYFLIAKSKMMSALAGKINERQMKVLLRMFAEGPDGFKGGLSAENYISITKTTRATATRDLTDLVQKGALSKSGELRHTRYRLNIKK